METNRKEQAIKALKAKGYTDEQIEAAQRALTYQPDTEKEEIQVETTTEEEPETDHVDTEEEPETDHVDTEEEPETDHVDTEDSETEEQNLSNQTSRFTKICVGLMLVSLTTVATINYNPLLTLQTKKVEAETQEVIKLRESNDKVAAQIATRHAEMEHFNEKVDARNKELKKLDKEFKVFSKWVKYRNTIDDIKDINTYTNETLDKEIKVLDAIIADKDDKLETYEELQKKHKVKEDLYNEIK